MISSGYTPDIYTGNGATTVFAYGNKISAASELKVTKFTIADETEEVLVLNTDYSVSGVGEDAGGDVTYPISGSPLASTHKLIIERVTPALQGTNLKEQGAWHASTHETLFDKLTAILQEHGEKLDRAALATVESGVSGSDLIDAITAAKVAAEAAQAAAETAQTGAETAETNAETAQTAAEAAQTAAETAQTAAETAQTAAETAKTGAETAETNAAASASAASTSATNAGTSETNAAASASAASTSATNAGTAQTAAEAAQTAAEAAQTAAETAQTGAETAETNAETAQTAAEAAQTQAESAANRQLKAVTQATHGFSVGDVIRHNGTNYVKAQADSEGNAAAVGVVVIVTDTNNFTYLSNGYTSELSGLTGGQIYYLDPSTAGAVTTSKPSTIGQIAKPILFSISTTEAVVLVHHSAEISNTEVDLESIKTNIALLAFKHAAAESLSIYNLVDGFIDAYVDETGVDTGTSTNESYDSAEDSYSPSRPNVATGGSAVSGGDKAGTDQVPTMTSDTAPSGTVFGDITDEWKIFDDNTGTNNYANHHGVPRYFGYDFGSGNAKTIQRYTMRAGSTVKMPTAWSFQGSNTGAWGGEEVTLDSQSSISWSSSEKKTFDFSNSTAYRYYRIYYTALNTGDEVIITEVEFIEKFVAAQAFDSDTGTYWGSSQTSGSVSGAAYIGYNIGSSKTCTRFKITQNASAQAINSVKVQGSNDGSSWTDIETVAITADTSEQTKDFTNATGYSYYRLLANAETSSGSWEVKELEFYEDPTNMTLVSDGVTAEAEPDDARIVLFEEDVDSITLNTDLTAEVSRDGGTTWTAITLSDDGDYGSGQRILVGSADISAQPSGTSMKYRIKTLNNKDLKLHGASLSWG